MPGVDGGHLKAVSGSRVKPAILQVEEGGTDPGGKGARGTADSV